MRVNLDNMDFGEEENFAQLLDAREKNTTSGSLQIGKIIQIDTDRDLAMIALPYSKLESMLSLSEIRGEDGNLLFNVGDEIELYTDRGCLTVRVAPSHRIPKGVVFFYHGYSEADVNRLMSKDHVDPYSGFPAYNATRCGMRKKVEA